MPRALLAVGFLLLAGSARAIKTELLTPTGLAAATGQAQPIEVVSGEAMVRFSSGTPVAVKKTRLAAVGTEFAGDVAATGWTHVQLATGIPVSQGLALLAAVPGIEEIAPNHVYRVSKVPNDTLFNSQYALSQVAAPAGWEYETGDTTLVTVAVADTGIDISHADLAGKMGSTTHQFCDPGANKNSAADNTACVAQAATDACGHGTQVAGVAAASTNNGSSVAGMSWGARLVSLKLFRDADCAGGCGSVTCGTDDRAIADALAAAQALHGTAQHGRIVVNLSVGANTACAAIVQTAVNDAVGAGVVVVAAAGNSSQGCSGINVHSPARCTGVIPVGANDSVNAMASYSCTGAELATSGVTAPGTGVLTTAMGGGTAAPTGTSFASPMVAGLAALVYAQKPAFTPAQIQNAIRAGAETIGAPATSQGAGRINAFRTLRFAVNGTFANFDGESKPIAFPNPFRGSGSINFAVPPSLGSAGLTIRIYTLDGQLVRSINGLTWNVKNTQGTSVASGTYAYVVTTALGSASGRFSVLR